jgi:hypothetical protein
MEIDCSINSTCNGRVKYEGIGLQRGCDSGGGSEGAGVDAACTQT